MFQYYFVELFIIPFINWLMPSDAYMSPKTGRRQAIIWTNAGILLFGPLGSLFSEILIEIDKFSFRKLHLKLSFTKWRPFCLGLIDFWFRLVKAALL